MQFVLLLLVSLSALVNASDWHKFMRKYATVKILSDCLGETYMQQWHQNYTDAIEYCEKQDPSPFLRDLPLDEYSFNDVTYAHDPAFPSGMSAAQSIPFLEGGAQVPGLPQQNMFSGSIDLTDFVAALQNNMTHPILLVPLPYPLLQQLGANQGSTGNIFLRKKRELQQGPIFDEQKIKEIYQNIQAKTGNFSCIFKKLNIFNGAFDVNVMGLVEQYDHLNLDESLKQDINEGILDCIKFATCKPLNKMSLRPPVVQRAKAFLKCEAKQRVAACVKSDVRNMQHKFDMTALNGVQAGSDVDEGDKMVAFLWGEFDKE